MLIVKKEINPSKTYSPVGNLAERAKLALRRHDQLMQPAAATVTIVDSLAACGMTANDCCGSATRSADHTNARQMDSRHRLGASLISHKNHTDRERYNVTEVHRYQLTGKASAAAHGVEDADR